MPVIYKPQQSSLPTEDGLRLYHPRVVLTGSVNTNQIAREIAELSSLSTGDVKNVLDNLVTVMTRHLQSSESVSLDGLGSFRYTLNSSGKGVQDAADVSAAQATLKVRFQPASTRNLNGTLATRSLVTGAKCVRFDQVETESGTEEGTGGEEGGGGAPLG